MRPTQNTQAYGWNKRDFISSNRKFTQRRVIHFINVQMKVLDCFQGSNKDDTFIFVCQILISLFLLFKNLETRSYTFVQLSLVSIQQGFGSLAQGLLLTKGSAMTFLGFLSPSLTCTCNESQGYLDHFWPFFFLFSGRGKI